MTMQKIIVTADQEIWSKIFENTPNMGLSPIFVQKLGSVTFAPLQRLNFMQNFRENWKIFSETFKGGPTDQLAMDGQKQ